MLSKLDLQEVYDSSTSDLVKDLQIPLLSNSTAYLRGVGYFSSGWLRIAASGLIGHIENGGKACVVVSPILERHDWEAMQTGHAAVVQDTLNRSLAIAVDRLAHELEHNTVNALAWMVADNLLEFRFAVERMREGGDYHDKVAVFDDNHGNCVAIHGSFNDSVKATLNGEAFSVFRSWVPGQEPFVLRHKRRLQELWRDENAQFKTYEIPDAIREKVIKLRETSDPPYNSTGAKLAQTETPTSVTVVNEVPIELRSYQSAAIEKWRSAGYRGILEMATGTGKTITALSAARASVDACGTRSIVILVPYLHLMEQWGEDARRFGLNPQYCSGNNPDWPRQIRSAIMNAASPSASPACIIAVHQTSATERFENAISRLDGGKLLLIADEVHGLGARHMRKALNEVAAQRLGLSATPDRWFDDDGTAFIKSYFEGVCYELPLEQAIGTILTPYRYYPQIINLESDERAEYTLLSKQIASAIAHAKDDSGEKLKSLLLRRTRIVSAARQKLPQLFRIVEQLKQQAAIDGTELRDILVYAPAGHHKDYLVALSGMGLRCHEFVHSVSLRRREEVLRQFAAGHIQVLVAVKCLDEGVDVPSTRTAFILASSTNPREFVQRRGRVLRRFKGKERADVYDFLVLPSGSGDVDKGLLRREMPRFAEFASSAINEFDARSIVRPILDANEMLPLLDKRPWDVYNELKQSEWDVENEYE